MPRQLISSGSRFETEYGYSRAVVDGDYVWLSGTTGFDYKAMTIADGATEQCEQVFRNIAAALAEAGCSLADVVRALYVVPDRADWPACGQVIGRHFRNIRPASTMLVAKLIEDRIRIEIEVTARLPKQS